MGGIIVIADTHFGLKKGNVNRSMPGYVAEFLEWVKSLEKEPETVKIVEGDIKKGVIKDKTISSPDKLILLGDIIELWDSDNETVAASILSMLPTLSQIKAEKIYVLGNHDDILERAILKNPETHIYMKYFLGESALTIVDQYPANTPTEKYGDESYLFVHGHQFDKDFTGPFQIYKVYPLMRTVANSLTFYVPLLFVLSAGITGIIWILQSSFPWEDFRISLLLFFLSIPYLGIRVARPFWSFLTGMRYRKEETLKTFAHWWEKTVTPAFPENVNVVYGHTHFLNYIPSPKHEKMVEEKGITLGDMHAKYKTELDKKNVEERHMPALINISAWITDFHSPHEKLFLKSENVYTTSKKLFTRVKTAISKKKEERKRDRLTPESVTAATFLVIDEEGFEYFGWNWDTSSQKIFHIPKDAILKRREKGPVTDDEGVRAVLKDIGWPNQVIARWEKDPHNT